MKTILLPIQHDQGQEARLQAALDAARAFDAHLVCLDLLDMPAIWPAGDYYDGVAFQVVDQLREDFAAIRNRLQQRLAGEDVRWDWRKGEGTAITAVKGVAALADLVVLSSRLGAAESNAGGQMVGQAAAILRRPVLAVPPALRRFEPDGLGLVAWDGSHEAREALHAAVPILQLSSEVILFDCTTGNGPFIANDAARYLAENDITSDIELVKPGSFGDIGPSILDRAGTSGATLVVMGAFGHWPLTEAIFGGVTRFMLAHSDIPLLLAH